MKKICMTVLFLGICQLAVMAQSADSCYVVKMVTATNVEEREPVEESKEFSADIGKVFCWSKVGCTQLPDTIYHVWFMGEEKMATVPLAVKYPTMRTWSHKNVIAGEWRVEIQDRKGKVLGAERFSVK
ncbi:DUF2914 domain-containing protein [candidate division KSB1 bacterium]|nr:DUF2914 domain-containing protein [candidate division KSB1 bacterium]